MIKLTKCRPLTKTRNPFVPEELEEAAMLVLRITRGITKEELIPEIARVLGYARTGDKVERSASKAMKRLVESGRDVERAGFLIPCEK